MMRLILRYHVSFIIQLFKLIGSIKLPIGLCPISFELRDGMITFGKSLADDQEFLSLC